MRPCNGRKLPRFFVVNPRSDRRMELRFYSREIVTARWVQEGEKRMAPAVASDISKSGLRMRSDAAIPENARVQISFSTASDHISCFGAVVWARPAAAGHGHDFGVDISEWHGIVKGSRSYLRYLGNRKKFDRRQRPR